MPQRKTLTELRSDFEAALAAGDVPSVATAAQEIREHMRALRSSGVDPRELETADALRIRANVAVADRLRADVERAATAEIALPDDYRLFGDELAADDGQFAQLAARTRDVLTSRLLAGTAASEEGD